MEPIRPDRDEVSAREQARRPSGGSPKGAPKSGGSKNPRGGGGAIVPVVLVVLVAVVAGWFIYQQQQRLATVQENLAEAEDWISRSKLSMARFEGRLSEADRELLESGSEIGEKLDFLDSEMRKLWGVSNDRNRKAIAANTEAVGYLEDKTDYLDKQRAELRQLIEAQDEQLAALTGELETVSGRLAQLQQGQQQLAAELESQASGRGELVARQDELAQQVTRLGQRQSLSLDELRARLDAVEKQVASAGDQSAINRLGSNLSELQEVVESIDASRAQLTRRLLSLEERVRGGGGG